MGTKEKLIERILSCPKDFTYDEAKRLFGILDIRKVTKVLHQVPVLNL